MALTYKDTGTVGTPSKIEVRSEVGRLVGMILKPPDGRSSFSGMS
jgi:hypothetical protein